MNLRIRKILWHLSICYLTAVAGRITPKWYTSVRYADCFCACRVWTASSLGHQPVIYGCNYSVTIFHGRAALASFPVSPKKRGGESLVTSAVDFWHLALAVPIRLQNKTMCTGDILSIDSAKNCQLQNELISVLHIESW